MFLYPLFVSMAASVAARQHESKNPMPYLSLKCPKGHVFKSYVGSRYEQVPCPECRIEAHRDQARTYQYASPSEYTFKATDYDTGPAFGSANLDTPADSFSSGGGGDFGGGGASGDF